jgi:hypothetical protein
MERPDERELMDDEPRTDLDVVDEPTPEDEASEEPDVEAHGKAC